jgi:sugar O-acyltransferase (sialic acid O-acetyltransferase NeuD family)
LKKPLLIIGAGGHAKACLDVVETGDKYQVVGLVGLPNEKGEKILNYPVIGDDGDFPGLVKKHKNILIGIGQIESPSQRKNYFHKILQLGGILPQISSPNANISKHAKVNAGSIIMHGATLQAEVCVGKNCIINDHTLLEHGAIVEDHCHISTSAILNGEVQVGEGSFIGSGSIVQEGVVIPPYSVVPMGTVLKRNKSK